MPKGYAIFTEDVRDREAMRLYAQAAIPTVLAAGGVPIIAGRQGNVLEGEWHGNRTVILEFPSVEAAQS